MSVLLTRAEGGRMKVRKLGPTIRCKPLMPSKDLSLSRRATDEQPSIALSDHKS